MKMHDLPPAPSDRLSNAGAAEPTSAALLEALWRAEELAGALDAAQRDLGLLREQLTAAEHTIAELTEIGDAAQLAIDRLRASLQKEQQRAERAGAERGAVAAELFEHKQRAAAEMAALGEALYRAAAGGGAEFVLAARKRGGPRRPLAALRAARHWARRLLRGFAAR